MLFQFMPRLSEDEYAALEKSIREHGVQVPILVDENRSIIDGHHRKEIADRLGVDCPKRMALDLDDTAKRTLALSLNLDRRHLTREQKRDLVAASLKADPDLSDREHAARTGVTHPTVAAARKRQEEETPSTGKSFQLPETSSPEPVESVDTATGEINPQTSGAVEAPAASPAPESDPEPPKRTGRDGRRRAAPAPRRTALTKTAFTAGVDLRRLTNRIEKLAGDDRLKANKDDVASQLRSHLIRAVEVCQDLLDRIDN